MADPQTRRAFSRRSRRRKFAERSAGGDFLEDIAGAAEMLRDTHLGAGRAAYPQWDDLHGEQRIYWALMLQSVSKASGIPLDDLIEGMRETARNLYKTGGDN